MSNHLDPLEPRHHLSAVALDPTWPGNFSSPPMVIGEQPDHRLITLSSDKNGNYFGRLGRDGVRDKSYRAPLPSDNGFYQSGWLEAAVDGQGRLVVAYADDNRGDYRPDIAGVIRFNADGTRDTAFGEVRLAPPGRSDGLNVYVQSMSINDAGDIVLYTNTAITGDSWQAHMVRITRDGAINAGWGENGYVTIKPRNMIVTRTWTLDDGTTWAIGGGTTGPFLLALDARGRSRRELGVDGRITFPTAFRSQFTSVLHVDQQGKIYLGLGERSPKVSPGGALPGGLPARSVARMNPNGTLDTTFGFRGFVTLDRPEGYLGPIANGLVEDEFGRLVVQTTDGTMLRFFADGQPDLSFDSDGRAQTNRRGQLLLANPDGIYYVNDNKTSRYTTLARFTVRPVPGVFGGNLLTVAADSRATVTVSDDPDGRLRVQLGSTVRTFARIARVKIFLTDSYDTIEYHSNRPVDIIAGGGDDRITIGANATVPNVDTGEGNDRVTTASSVHVDNPLGGDYINGTGRFLTVFSDKSVLRPDRTVAAAANVKVNGTFATRAVFNLGAGNDTIDITAPTVSVQDAGGKNDFTLRASRAAYAALLAGRTSLVTGAGSDLVRALAGRHRIDTGEGTDTIFANNQSRDTLIGGAGNDTATVDEDDEVSLVEML